MRGGYLLEAHVRLRERRRVKAERDSPLDGGLESRAVYLQC